MTKRAKIFKPKDFKPRRNYGLTSEVLKIEIDRRKRAKIFKPEDFKPRRNFGLTSKVPKIDLDRGKFHFNAGRKNEVTLNRIRNEKIAKERKEKIKELNKAYKRYDKALNDFNSWRNKFIKASKQFEKVDPQIASMLKGRAREPRGAIKKQMPDEIDKAAAKLSYGTKAMRREYTSQDTTQDIPNKYSPKLYENLLKKQAAKVADVKLKKNKRGNLMPDYAGLSDAEKKKKQRAYRNAMRRNPNLKLSSIVEVMDLWHKTFPWTSVESGDVYNAYLIVTDKKADKNSQNGEIDDDTLQKMYKLLIGSF